MPATKPKPRALPLRLQIVANLIVPGQPLWDIGCDHGYLGLHALLSQRASEVYFVEPVKSLLDSIRTQLDKEIDPTQTYRQKTSCFFLHQKGQMLPWQRVKGTVVIAGMGGALIKEIVSSIPKDCFKNIRLVLAPENHPAEVRRFLFQQGWRLLPQSEVILQQRNRFREIFAVEKQGLPLTALPSFDLLLSSSSLNLSSSFESLTSDDSVDLNKSLDSEVSNASDSSNAINVSDKKVSDTNSRTDTDAISSSSTVKMSYLQFLWQCFQSSPRQQSRYPETWNELKTQVHRIRGELANYNI